MKHPSLTLLLSCGFLLQLAIASAAEPSGINGEGQLVKVSASQNGAFAFTTLSHGVQVQIGDLTKNVLFYGPGIVRVNANAGKAHTVHPSLTITARPAPVPFEVKVAADALAVSSNELRVLIDKKTGSLTFERPDGSIITREQPTEIKEVTISEAPTYEVKQAFMLSPEESLYGLGQYNHRYMDYRGKEVLLIQTNIGIVIPFLVSTNRYGIVWDVYSKTIFKDNSSGASFWSESAPSGVDYYFIAGENMDGVIGGYRHLTGKAPMFAKSAFGLFMSKERYKTQDELLKVARTFRERQFPLDTIVQDWQYWGSDKDGTWSGMTWNKERFPDPAGMIRKLHDDHFKLMISIWPSVGHDTDLARELDSKGLRHEPLHWISKKARIYDAYSAEGRAIYFKHIKKGLLDVGVDALWMDGTEVEVGTACHDPHRVAADIKGLGNNAMGDYARYLNTYTLVTTQGVYEGQRAGGGNKRVFTLTRSAFLGQQRYAAVSWSGDTRASWKTFRDQISGGINVAMAGQPYWTQDTGGFFVPGEWQTGGKTNPAYNELFARWHQFGAFNPIYRIHGTNIEREPYTFLERDPEVYRSLVNACHLRYRLLPYIYSLAWMSTVQDYTMMRGLPMDFPDDRAARQLDDQFMFGRAFLVHPVTRPMFRVPPPPPGTIPAEAYQTPDGKPGIAVQYFEGKNFEQLAGKVIEPKIDHTWPGPPLAEPPGGLKSVEDFSARWEAVLTMPESGEYEIGAEGDDGVRLWLDNKLVVDDWGVHSMRWRGQKLPFRQGQKVALKVEYYQGRGDRGLRLGWRLPSQSTEAPRANDLQKTYLPSGANWYDFWTGTHHAGGQTVEQSVPLDQMPLFVRAGTILPLGPVMQYATEKPEAPIELRVYRGADAQFTLYADDNETYNYEKGEFSTIPLAWDEKRQTLTIGERAGEFPGMQEEVTFRVGFLGESGTAATTAREVRYTGQALTLSASKK